MTATAVYVGDQLREYFKLEVAVIPPNTPNIREDEPDRIYATRGEKDEALIARDRRGATRRAGRCWSARWTSRSPSRSPHGLADGRRPVRGAQRQERRRGGARSSPRPARSAR